MSEIYDIGYRHYDGPRLGRRHTVLALGVHSLRGVFGLGRPARSKIMPFSLAAIMMFPVVVSIATMAMIQQRVGDYSGYAVVMQAVVAIFLASQAPTVVAPDLRHRVLPLYLSRPVTITEYVGAKVAAMTVALFLLVAVPLTVMFVGDLLVDMPGPPPTGEYLGAVTMAAVLAVLLSTVGLALAALTPRRGLGVASVITVYLLTTGAAPMIYAALYESGYRSEGAWGWLINPFWLVDAAQVWLFGSTAHVPDGAYPGGPAPILIVLALIAAAVAVLSARYRKAASQ
ncbi:ABC transporter permease [Nonomuraea ferruginea]|uniref:ABC transporter permease n=1 Tax=Nonomuraea ferruginea TaxID=46174 RepID=A0ABT4SPT4_9ACTN|nr:ABC transporter permease [Nonomuraea ferruginea]MDA0639045.1 ABC transporter permease [Nonomuraea ferruginea]